MWSGGKQEHIRLCGQEGSKWTANCGQEGNKNTYDFVVRKEASGQQIVVRKETRTHTTPWSGRKQVDSTRVVRKKQVQNLL